MVKYVKTTLVIQDELYDLLVREAKREYGKSRSMSALLNDILRKHFTSKKSLFGTTKRFDISDLRDKKDRDL